MPHDFTVGFHDEVFHKSHFFRFKHDAFSGEFSPGIRLEAKPNRQWKDAPAIVQWAIGAGVVAVLLKYLSGMHVAWRPALIGGVLTFLAINIGNRLFGIYLSTYGATSVAGAAGSVMVGLVWLYVIAQIVLAGAELTRAIQTSDGPGQVAVEGPVEDLLDDETSED